MPKPQTPQPDREMLYKVSFSPHRDARVIDKKHPHARAAWLGIKLSNLILILALMLG
jgi:hypothetical protein